MLVTVQKKSYKEASEILQVPIGTIMSRIHEARRILVKNNNQSKMNGAKMAATTSMNSPILQIYRSKSDYKYNPTSSTGKIKTIPLYSTSKSKEGPKEVLSQMNTTANTEENAPPNLNHKNAAADCCSTDTSRIYAKYIKQRPFKGKIIYSFVLCEINPISTLNRSPLKNRSQSLTPGGSRVSEEKPIVKFASTDRAQVEALWTAVNNNITNTVV